MARADASERNWTIRALRGVYTIVKKSQAVPSGAAEHFMLAVDNLLREMGAETQTARVARQWAELERL